MSDVAGVRVLISGATSGLGLAMASALTTAGAHVAMTSRNPERAVEAAQRLIDDGPGIAVGVAMDVRDEQSVGEGVTEVLERLGGVDVLVNNAGIGMRTVNRDFMSNPQPFWMVEPDLFSDLVATNVTGYFLLARAVAPLMIAAGHGKIVNVSVSATTTRRAGFVPYGPSRAATDSLSHVMAADLAGTGVTVNLLAPGGATATGMVPDDIPDDVRATLLHPSIIGPPIRWLASADSDGITDQRFIATEFTPDIGLTSR